MSDTLILSPQRHEQQIPYLPWGMVVLTVLLLVVATYEGLSQMVIRWIELEEFSHGFILPVVALYLAWLRFQPADVAASGTRYWPGVLLLLLGSLLALLGEMSAIFEVIQYGFVISLFGVIVVALGDRAFLRMMGPLVILFFMVPFPSFIYRNLSAQLQLWSSALGVEFIQLFDIPVFLEGNVIDLGSMKLQVVEACSGLRYLFPMMSLAYICAYIYQAPLWQRTIIFLSSMPITLIMNSIRIGAIGVTVEYWGQEMAEGFLHDFEGWIMFMFSFMLLLLEISLLSRLLKPRKPLIDRFQLEQATSTADAAHALANIRVTPALLAALLIVSGFLTLMTVIPNRVEVVPERVMFREFPLRIGQWTGTKKAIDIDFLNELKFTDYILADYRSDKGDILSFYIAYYDSQRKGRSVHSPAACLPGDGWEMKHMEKVTFPAILMNGVVLQANKALIQKGDARSVVYYWFDQRGRNITNEFAVKWYLFQDSITKSRSDGSLVRLVIPLKGNQPESAAYETAEAFLRDMAPRFPDYVPR